MLGLVIVACVVASASASELVAALAVATNTDKPTVVCHTLPVQRQAQTKQMSLSFVSKSVQTAKEDGGFEEKPIEGKEAGGRSGVTGTSKSLFEQLRANQEEADAERAEQEKAIQRGTVELNEEDAAHLDALERQRQKEEAQKQQSTQEALAAFRAARADRLEADSSPQLEGPGRNEGAETRKATDVATSKPSLPKVVVVRKKKRRLQQQNVAASDDAKRAKQSNATENDANQQQENLPKDKNSSATLEPISEETQGALGSLLLGYGSSDED